MKLNTGTAVTKDTRCTKAVGQEGMFVDVEQIGELASLPFL